VDYVITVGLRSRVACGEPGYVPLGEGGEVGLNEHAVSSARNLGACPTWSHRGSKLRTSNPMSEVPVTVAR
jgi:hypothetical protein